MPLIYYSETYFEGRFRVWSNTLTVFFLCALLKFYFISLLNFWIFYNFSICKVLDKSYFSRKTFPFTIIFWLLLRNWIFFIMKYHFGRIVAFFMVNLNPFVPNAPFLYPLKTLENLIRFFAVNLNFQNFVKTNISLLSVTKDIALLKNLFSTLNILPLFRNFIVLKILQWWIYIPLQLVFLWNTCMTVFSMYKIILVCLFSFHTIMILSTRG